MKELRNFAVAVAIALITVAPYDSATAQDDVKARKIEQLDQELKNFYDSYSSIERALIVEKGVSIQKFKAILEKLKSDYDAIKGDDNFKSASPKAIVELSRRIELAHGFARSISNTLNERWQISKKSSAVQDSEFFKDMKQAKDESVEESLLELSKIAEGKFAVDENRLDNSGFLRERINLDNLALQIIENQSLLLSDKTDGLGFLKGSPEEKEFNAYAEKALNGISKCLAEIKEGRQPKQPSYSFQNSLSLHLEILNGEKEKRRAAESFKPFEGSEAYAALFETLAKQLDVWRRILQEDSNSSGQESHDRLLALRNEESKLRQEMESERSVLNAMAQAKTNDEGLCVKFFKENPEMAKTEYPSRFKEITTKIAKVKAALAKASSAKDEVRREELACEIEALNEEFQFIWEEAEQEAKNSTLLSNAGGPGKLSKSDMKSLEAALERYKEERSALFKTAIEQKELEAKARIFEAKAQAMEKAAAEIEKRSNDALESLSNIRESLQEKYKADERR